MWRVGGRAGQRGRVPVFYMALTVSLACLLAACGGPTQAARPKTAKASPTATATPVPHGWNPVVSPMVGAEGSLVAVSALSATDAWAVGQYQGPVSLQQTLAEHWNGTQWSVVSSPSPGTEFNILQGVSADAPNDAWAVGYATNNKGLNQPVIEHWNGSAWSVSAGVAGGSGGGQLNGVAALSPREVWAVGSTTTLGTTTGQPDSESALIEHWNGSAWTSVASAAVPSSIAGSSFNALTAVAALASNDVWAVGQTIEHWDGTIWKLVPAPDPESGQHGYSLTGIAAISADDIWAVGSGAPPVPHGCGAVPTSIIAHWDGTQWSSVPFPAPPVSYSFSDFFSLASVAAVASTDVWAVGGVLSYYRGKSAAIIPLIEHWDGSEWSIAAGPTTGTVEGLAGVAASHDGIVWAVGEAEAANGPGATHVERLGGQVAVVDSPSPGTLSNELKGIASISPSDMWAVGDSSGGTLTEHWNGSAWGYYPSPNGAPADDTLSAVAARSSSDVWAVGNMPGQGVGYTTRSLVEHWNGSQWTTVADAAVSDKTSRALFGVTALSAHDVWAVGRANGPFAEHWDGSQWTAVATAAALPGGDLSTMALLGVAALAPNDVWAVGGQPQASCGGELPALIEHWDGTQWSSIPNTPGGVLYGVAADSANDVWAVGDGAGTFVMHYDGTSWSVVSMPATPKGVSLNLAAVAARAPNDVWAVGQLYSGQGLSGVILHWDRTTWSQTQVTHPGMTASVLNGVAIAAPGNVWAVGSYCSLAYMDPSSLQALIEHYTP